MEKQLRFTRDELGDHNDVVETLRTHRTAG